MRMAAESARIQSLKLAVIGVGYAAVCRIMLAPIFNFRNPATANFAGDARLIIWTLAWDNHALLDGVRVLFDANIFYPARNALAYSEHLFGISLFTLPVYAATRNPVLAYNSVWLLSYVLAALTAHYVAWRHTRDHLAAIVAGLACAFCFFRMHHGHGHLHMIWSFWIPLSFVAMERWLTRPTWRRLLLFVAIVTLQALASWYQAVMVFIADALFLGWLLFVEGSGRRDRVRIAAQAAVGAALALAIVWPFARHYYVLSSGGPVEAARGVADLAGYLVPPENTFLGQWLLARGIKGPRWIWGELTVYLGWTTIALAAVGALASARRRDAFAMRLRFFAALAVLAVALAMGPWASEVASNSWTFSPFGLLARVPGINLFRVPARFAELLTLALAMLAAGGCAMMHARFGRAGRLVTIAAIPLLLAESYVVQFPGGAPQPFPPPAIYRFIATLPPGAVVSFPDYAGGPEWFAEADYQYFSTTHWHPIANGYSRAEPPGFRALMDRLKTFPDPASARTMRDAGILYVVLHGHHVPALVGPAQVSGDFRLLARFEDDYLFEVIGQPGA
jgi:hypothetical protein